MHCVRKSLRMLFPFNLNNVIFYSYVNNFNGTAFIYKSAVAEMIKFMEIH